MCQGKREKDEKRQLLYLLLCQLVISLLLSRSQAFQDTPFLGEKSVPNSWHNVTHALGICFPTLGLSRTRPTALFPRSEGLIRMADEAGDDLDRKGIRKAPG